MGTRNQIAVPSQCVQVRGARQHNLRSIDIDIPRNAMVVFAGVSGSGKSSLAFGTLYAEAQRRYLESVSPYARRLFHQLSAPEVDRIDGLPPAVALQQQRGAPTTRSSVGSVTTISNSLRILLSRAGDYPKRQQPLPAEAFSPNTPAGACPRCHGLGRIYDATEASMVPDPSLTIRERAVAAWPPAWHGQNLRDMLVTLGYDIDTPWRQLPKKQREWILFTEEQPSVPVFIGFSASDVRRALRRKDEPSYYGNFSSARRFVLETFSKTDKPSIRKRAARYLVNVICPECNGRRLRAESLSVRFGGLNIDEIGKRPIRELTPFFASHAARSNREADSERSAVEQRVMPELLERLAGLERLGLGYLTLERSTPTLSPGEIQRMRIATQVQSNLFGVVYVLDEPTAGLHPADTAALLGAMQRLKAAGNSLFVVEHDIDVIRHADWVVEIGPDAGTAGGRIVYNGPPEGLRGLTTSKTGKYLYARDASAATEPRRPNAWLELRGITRNNIRQLNLDLPLGVFTTVTGVSGAGKSSLVSQALVELLAARLGQRPSQESLWPEEEHALEQFESQPVAGTIAAGAEHISRVIAIDQRPIGRTPRSNVATYTGVFDRIRKLFAATPDARKRGFDSGRFSFNVAKGRCPKCEGEGAIMVELLFLPSVYAPCPECGGTRYNPETLKVRYHEHSIAEVLAMTVDNAVAVFNGDAQLIRSLAVLQEVGLGYLRLGQSATELSGGEAQRMKLASELHRAQRGGTLYVLDEPTTGLHPADVERLLQHLKQLVEAGSTVVVVEHDMDVVAASDWVIDMGPGAGDEGGEIVASGPPRELAWSGRGATAPFLKEHLLRGGSPRSACPR